MENDNPSGKELASEPAPADVIEVETLEAGPDPAPSPRRRAAFAAILIVLALASLFGIAPMARNPATYRAQIQTLDEKKTNVMALTATSTAASAAVSLLPGDAGQPIAEKLADISSYLIVILAVIYLEKFLITILGFAGFGVLVPLALALFAVMQLIDDRRRVRYALGQFAMRFLVFGIALSLVVPVSVWVTDQIDATYAESVSQQIDDAKTDSSAQADKGDSGKTEESGDSGILGSITDFLEDSAQGITDAGKGALDTLTSKLNQLVDTIAVMIVTSCLVPLIVLVAFFWLAKSICGIDLGSPDRLFAATSAHARKATAAVHRAGEGARAKRAERAGRD